MFTFTFDPAKARTNQRKHRITFEEAQTVFENDPLAYTDFDPDHSEADLRYFTIGTSTQNRLLYIVHNEEEGSVIRLISARRATTQERSLYEQG